MFREFRREIIVLACAVLLIPISYVVGRIVDTHVLHKESHPVAGYAQKDPCPGESGQASTCWMAYYTAFLEKYPAVDALADLKARYDAGEGARTFCHPLLHIIGAKAGEEYGSVAEAYKHAEVFCRAGYYHGVLERLFGDADETSAEKLLSDLDSFCKDVPGKERYSYYYFSCVHGIGHGLMAYFAHYLFKSLAGCGRLSREWEQAICAGGAFMENVISDSPEAPSKFLKTDDPLYPCNVVKDLYRGQCYLMQTSHMLSVFGGDFKKTFEACSRVEARYRVSCYQSIGRDASGWSYGSEEAALHYCSFGKTLEQRSNCLLGAAVDYIQSVSHEGARSLCALGEDGARISCIRAVEYNLKAL